MLPQVNFLLVEALRRYYVFYGDDLKVAVPTGSKNMMNLKDASEVLAHRLTKLFRKVRRHVLMLRLGWSLVIPYPFLT